jgi:cellulose synthase/poly-beta-1,6-N-acetylglucosamine synthase-like glycosyltransferase
MSPSLSAAFCAASPRLSPRAMPLVSGLIYAAVFALWLMLLSCAFFTSGIFAWSAGLFYIAYDTALLALITRLTWPKVAASLTSANASAASGKSLLGKSLAGKSPDGETLDIRPSLGVIIAAYNEAAVLPEILTALCGQTDRPDLILVVDDGSTDASVRILSERFRIEPASEGKLSSPSTIYPFLRMMRLPRSGKAEALNAATVEVDTDIIVAIDADTALDRHALEAMRQAFASDTSLVAAGGLLVPVCDRSLLGRVLQWFQTYEYIRSMVARFAWMSVNSLVLISGAFSAFRRDALVRVGGFDSRCMVEDYELTHRMHRYSVEHGLGWRLQMITGAHAVTHAPGSFSSFMMQRRRWFAGYLQTQFWNRDLAGNARFGRLGTMMMTIKAFDTLQPIYGLTAGLLLIVFLLLGKAGIAIAAFGLIAAKIAVDLAINSWMVYVYRRVTGDRVSSRFADIIIATLLEPFSFQLLRQAGAAWGWISFLTRRQRWGTQSRTTLADGARAAVPFSPSR